MIRVGLVILLVLGGCLTHPRTDVRADVETYCAAVCAMESKCEDPSREFAARCARECPQIIAAVSVRPGLDYKACTERCLARPCGRVLRCIVEKCA